MIKEYNILYWKDHVFVLKCKYRNLDFVLKTENINHVFVQLGVDIYEKKNI